jgi:hypothetical protein
MWSEPDGNNMEMCRQNMGEMRSKILELEESAIYRNNDPRKGALRYYTKDFPKKISRHL